MCVIVCWSVWLGCGYMVDLMGYVCWCGVYVCVLMACARAMCNV